MELMTIAFYRYFYEQNEAIKSGELSGLELELKTLGIGNGIIDAAIQFPFVRVLAGHAGLSLRCRLETNTESLVCRFCR